MQRADRRWSAPAALGCTFTQLCQLMERRGLLQLGYGGENTEVVRSHYAEAKVVAAGGPRRRDPPPPAPRRWSDPAARRAGPSDSGDRWEMS